MRLSRREIQRQKVDAELRKRLELYAKTTCQKLCDTVIHSLPREIRDIIYGYLHQDETIYVGPEYLSNSGQPCESDRGAHYWDPEYVGEAMRAEIVESWYRTTLFYFYDKANNTHVVDQFLVLDRWGLGLKPRDYICRVRFDLGSSENQIHGDLPCHGTHVGLPRCRVIGLAESLTKPLQSMRQLPNHIHFFIRIHTYRGIELRCLYGEELQKTLEILVKDLKALNAAGHRFIVQWSELMNLEFTSKTVVYDAELWMEEIQEAAKQVRLQ